MPPPNFFPLLRASENITLVCYDVIMIPSVCCNGRHNVHTHLHTLTHTHDIAVDQITNKEKQPMTFAQWAVYQPYTCQIPAACWMQAYCKEWRWFCWHATGSFVSQIQVENESRLLLPLSVHLHCPLQTVSTVLYHHACQGHEGRCLMQVSVNPTPHLNKDTDTPSSVFTPFSYYSGHLKTSNISQRKLQKPQPVG